jgi:hypothetical protein
MSQGNDFANYASSVEDRGSASEDVWFVAVSSDDIKQMTIDQLDEAFRLGVISAQTAVWTEGMEAWAPLGEVADLDGDESSGETEAVAEAPAAAAPAAEAAHLESAPSHRRTNPGWHNPFDPPGSTAPASNGMGSPASIFSEPPPAHGSASMGPSSFAPVTASYAPPGVGSLNHSTGPVALNVDEDSPPVARGRRFRPERWLLAAAGVIAVGVIAFNNSDLFSGSKSVAAAEKQASAAAIVAHPYEVPADKAGAKGAAPAAEKAAEKDDGKDAPIGSLKGEAGEEDNSEAAPSAATPAPATKGSAGTSRSPSSKDMGSSKEALHDGFAKAFSKAPGKESKHAEKPVKASKASKMAHTKTPSRAASASSKSKKPGAPKSGSAFDPLNGSLP